MEYKQMDFGNSFKKNNIHIVLVIQNFKKMKTLKLFLTGFILSIILQQSVAQAPQGFKYQAVCRDNSGVVIQNQAVGLRLSVHDSQPEGIIVYQETFTTTTNQYGLITADVGSGNVVSGTFALIPWESGNKFLELELDMGSGFVSMGTSQLLSVPYALYAVRADSLTGGIIETDPEVGANALHYIPKWDGTSLSSSSIIDNGFVGIGTETPGKRLTVAGNAQVQSDGDWLPGASARLYLGPDDNMWIEHIHSGGLNLEVCSGWPLYFRNGGNVKMAISGSGNVGIGTSNPAYLLEVTNDASFNNVRVGRGNGNVVSNTVLGSNNLSQNTTGDYNTAIGYEALKFNTSGLSNTAIGYNSLFKNTSGNFNIAIGHASLAENTTGYINTAVGYDALLYNTTGYGNTATGGWSMHFKTTGYYNTAVGQNSLMKNTSGSNNTAVGMEAGFNNIIGSNNVFLGYRAGYSETGSNKLYIANNSSSPLIYGDFSTGFMGIGTTTPSVKLQIKPNADDQSLWLMSPGSDDRYLSLWRGGNAGVIDVRGNAQSNLPYLSLQVGGSEKMVITHSGNIGIGTTTPTAKLDVWNGNISVSNGGVLANTGFWGDALRTNWGNDLTLQSSYENKGIIFKTYSGEKMRIDAAGNIGIGTASPSSILHLIGDSPRLKIQTQTNLTDPSLEFVKYGVRTMEIKLSEDGGATGLQFIDQNSAQVRLFIEASTSYVGIGTTTPDATLDVNGQVKISGGSPGAGKVLTSDAAGLATWEAPASAGAHYIGEIYGGGIVFYVYDNGQHGLIAATSDLSNAIPWSNGVYKYTGTMGDGLGAGEMNTAMIVATQIADNPTGNFAARICADFSTSDGTVTYGDWYLPSLYELNLLYLQKNIVGGFGTGRYWSSTEANNSNVNAWWVNFGFGYQGGVDKANNNSVRAIRAF
jgi:trimeric autotransporter adhesin